MANTNPPKKNQAWTARVYLESLATPGQFTVNPTVSAGDFKVDTDGAGFGNPATTPTVSPAAGAAVLVSLSATEMNGDVITLKYRDTAGTAVNADMALTIQTSA